MSNPENKEDLRELGFKGIDKIKDEALAPSSPSAYETKVGCIDAPFATDGETPSRRNGPCSSLEIPRLPDRTA